MPAATSVLSPDAPSPGPLMSQAIICNGMVYCSGSLGLDPQTGAFVLGTTGDRAVSLQPPSFYEPHLLFLFSHSRIALIRNKHCGI